MSVTFNTGAIVKGELSLCELSLWKLLFTFHQIFKVGLKTLKGKLPEGHFFAVAICHGDTRRKPVTGGLPLTIRPLTAVCLAYEPHSCLDLALRLLSGL